MLGVRRIDRYILSEFLLSFLVAFLFFFFIFFVNQILVLAEEIFSKKVPLPDVILVIVFSLPSILALAIPFGALVGSLMAVGRFSSDNEILALRASGVALGRILAPLLVIGLGLSLFSFVVNDYFLPLGNVRLSSMYRKILYTNPGVELEPFAVKRYQDTVIVTGAIEGNRIENLTIIDKNEDNQKRVISARYGFLEESRSQKGVVSIRLEDVLTQVPEDAQAERYDYTRSESMIYNILLKDFSGSFINPGPGEMSSLDVWKEIRKMEAALARTALEQERKASQALFDLAMELRYLGDFSGQKQAALPDRLPALRSALESYTKTHDRKPSDRNLELYRLEFHKKFSIPFSCMAFILFAFPVGLLARRSGRAVGFAVGLLMASLYWWVLFLGQTLGRRLELPPALAMWLPNVLVLAAGSTILILRRRR
jgi:lipopolysaccharide export system permease protein